MGNTPSQSGFHHPEDQLKNQLQTQTPDPNFPHNADSDDVSEPLSPMQSHNLPGANLPNSQNIPERNHSSNGSDFRPRVGSHLVSNSISGQSGLEPYSMDSLALDTTSSIATGDFSPSSLSPEPLKSEDPLGNLMKFKNGLKDMKKFHDLQSASPSVEMDSIQFNDDMLNHFDSLDEPSNSLDRDENSEPNSISTSSSGFGPFQKAKDILDKDIVTVNGLQVQPISSGTLNCSETDGSSETISKDSIGYVEEYEGTTTKEKPVDESLAESQVNNISPSSSGFISEADSPCTMNKISVPEEDEKDIMALNEPMHANLKDDLCSAPVVAKCEVHQVQQADFHTNDETQEEREEKDPTVVNHNLANPSVNEPSNVRNVSVIEINRETNCTSKQERVSSDDDDDQSNHIISNKFKKTSSAEGFGFGRKTLMFLPKANPVPESTSSCTTSHEDDDDHTELLSEDEYPSLCENDSQESEVGDEKIVISNLVFIDGQNEEDGGLYTQVFLKSTENNLRESGPEPMYTKPVPRLDQTVPLSEVTKDSKDGTKSHPKPPRKNLSPPPPPPIGINVNQQDDDEKIFIDEVSQKTDFSENVILDEKIDNKTKPIESDVVNPEHKINFAKNAKKIRKNMLNWESLDEFEKLEADITKSESSSDINDKDNKIPGISRAPNAKDRSDFSKASVKTLFENPSNGFNYGNVAFVDEIFVRKRQDEGILCTSRCNTLERQVYSSQDREIQEESIDFRKEASDVNEAFKIHSSKGFSSKTKLSTVADIRAMSNNAESPCDENEELQEDNKYSPQNYLRIEAKPSEALQKLQESAQRNSRLLSDPSYLQKMNNNKSNEQYRKELLLSTSSTRANLLIFNDDCTSTITTAIHTDTPIKATKVLSQSHNPKNYGTVLEKDMKPSETTQTEVHRQNASVMKMNENAYVNSSSTILPKSDVEGSPSKINGKVDPYMELGNDQHQYVIIPVPPPPPPFTLLKQATNSFDTEEDLRQNAKGNNYNEDKLKQKNILPPEGKDTSVTTGSSSSTASYYEKPEKVQHISKIYVSSELSQPEVQSQDKKLDFASEEQKSHKNSELYSLVQEKNKIPDFENNSSAKGTIENNFFIGIDDFEKTSPKKIAKPPRLTSNYRKGAFNHTEDDSNKSKGLKNEDFPCVEIFDGSTRRTSDPLKADSDNKLYEPKRAAGEIFGENEITFNQTYDRSSVNSSSVVANNTIITCNNGSFGDIQSGNSFCSQLNKLDLVLEEAEEAEEGETNQNTPSESESQEKASESSEKLQDEMAYTRVNLKRQSSFGMNGSENASISSNECSLVFLPKNVSTPCTTSEAIFQELRRKQAARFSENNGMQNNYLPMENENFTMAQKYSSATSKSSRFTLPMSQRNEELNSQGIEKDKNIPFDVPLGGVRNKPLSRKSSSSSLGEQGLQVHKNNLTGVRGKTMSPSLSNNFMEMNGIDNHTENEDNFMSAQEETFTKQLQEKENYINELQSNLESMKIKASSEPSYTRVLAEYEKTLSMYIQKVDEMKQKLDVSETGKRELIKERDQALEDLRNVESAFSDVHRKYERSKGLLENLKANEDTLLRRDQEMIQKILIRDKKIEALKEKAQDSLEQMHLDYENRIRDLEGENARLRAQFRKMEMKLDTLENDVEQKAKENAQLSALCDELINGQVVN